MTTKRVYVRSTESRTRRVWDERDVTLMLDRRDAVYLRTLILWQAKLTINHEMRLRLERVASRLPSR